MKTALVTGFAKNIGKSITQKLLDEGFFVVGVNCPKTTKEASELLKASNHLTSFTADFTSEESVSQLICQLKKYSFDVIVNNAGIVNLNDDGSICNEFIDFSYVKFLNVMRCNFDAPLRLCIELKDRIKEGGSIINIASGGGMRASYATLSYAASKSALINLTKSLSNSFYPYKRVRVNCISPGWVNSESPNGMGVSDNSPGGKAGLLVSLGRNAEPVEIANVVYFLTTEEASFINGANIVVDGGWLNHNVIYLEEATGKNLLHMKLVDD